MYEIIISIVTVVLSSIGSFIVTYYKYNKNIPLDKFELSYNRVYYPIYKIILNSDEKDINQIIEKVKFYILKGDKYVDGITKNLFKSLQENQNNSKLQKKQYRMFEENIMHYNEYLRKRLGYVVPTMDRIFKAIDPVVKLRFKMWVEICFIFFFFQMSSIFDQASILYGICSLAFTILLVVLIVQIMMYLGKKILCFFKKDK